MTDKYVPTYKVINVTGCGGCLNHVRHADNEKETDSAHERAFKRYNLAVEKRNRWIDTEFRDATLKVVECK